MRHSSATLPVILTGDRTTGPLHIGHYVGSLKNRVTLQTTHQQFLLLADAQALTDNAHNPSRIRDNVLEIATDYLAVGINISVASVLSLVQSPWWLAFTGFVGVAMVWFAATGYCIMANSLYWLGAEPRLAPERPAARDAALGTGHPAEA